MLLTMGLVLGSTRGVDAQANSAGEYQVLPLQHKPAAEMETMLSAMLPQLGEDVHVVADQRSNQVLLRGITARSATGTRSVEFL